MRQQRLNPTPGIKSAFIRGGPGAVALLLSAWICLLLGGLATELSLKFFPQGCGVNSNLRKVFLANHNGQIYSSPNLVLFNLDLRIWVIFAPLECKVCEVGECVVSIGHCLPI